jgi:hypothetical protein
MKPRDREEALMAEVLMSPDPAPAITPSSSR